MANRKPRALLSVTDKTGIEQLGVGLHQLGYELISTGGTAKALRAVELPVVEVSDVTGFPEMMDGRVKTLDPHIFAGILARRNHERDGVSLRQHSIDPIEVVVVNLYQFAEKAKDLQLPYDDLIEHIDIGGPSLIRAAAKNWRRVLVCTSPDKYQQLLSVLVMGPQDVERQRFEFSREAFYHTMLYERAISNELKYARMDENGVIHRR